MEVRVEGELGPGVTAKDVVLHIIGVLGAAGGTGYVIEYTGVAYPRDVSIEGRLTVSQHGDRTRRARWPDRARRHDIRLSEGPPHGPQRRGLGRGGRLLAQPRHRCRRSL